MTLGVPRFAFPPRARRWSTLACLALALAASPEPRERAAPVRDARRALPGEGPRLSAADGRATLVDVVVAAGLAERDAVADTETSLAVDPEDPRRLAISAFGAGWGRIARLWTSVDGGSTWRRSPSIPAPPGGIGLLGCPCDQTFAWGRGGILYGAVLANDGARRPTYAGATRDPTRAAAWAWRTRRDAAIPASTTPMSDQPWIAVGPDPERPDADLVYVATTDYGSLPPANHVTVLRPGTPPVRLRDRVLASSPRAGSFAAAALRVATNARTGAVAALWQAPLAVDPTTCDRRVALLLLRSVDGGPTWTGDRDGSAIVVAQPWTRQGRNDDAAATAAGCARADQKLGGVNALLGGVAALAVDPASGAALVAYAERGAGGGAPRVALARVDDDGDGAVRVRTRTVAAEVVAALPALAVAADGTIGVAFDSVDGAAGPYPRFTTHLAQSTDGGATFVDQPLLSFLSPSRANAHAAQRALGDYQQLRAAGDDFLLAFPANGAALGRAVASVDPVFARVRSRGAP